jgi:hypothetical protein
MPDLLLLSNSRAPGMEFLEHATGTYTQTMRRALAGLGVQVTGLQTTPRFDAAPAG